MTAQSVSTALWLMFGVFIALVGIVGFGVQMAWPDVAGTGSPVAGWYR